MYLTLKPYHLYYDNQLFETISAYSFSFSFRIYLLFYIRY